MKRYLICLYTVLCTMYTLSASAEIKYVFYFIGDGMGSNQVLSAEMYRSALEDQPLGRVQTLMTTFPVTGNASTHSASNGITDSAAAGTCLATGSKTKNGMLGLDADSARLTTIAEELKAQGWGVGIMTTVAIDHATPAAFYAHVAKRNKYYQIGQQLAESNFDFFGGAGFHHPQGKHDDKEINLYRNAEQAGYTIAHGVEEARKLLAHDQIQSTQPEPMVDKLILVQKDDDQGAKHGSNLPYAIDRQEGDLTLADIVSTAIPFLEARYERFFMMVEGGMVDYACHGNDVATSIGETWDMNEALERAYQFYLTHPEETLILVTADHETGGLALGNSDYTLHLDVLQHQHCSGWVLSDCLSKLFEDNKKPTWEQIKSVLEEKLDFWGDVTIEEDEELELKEIYKSILKGKSKDTKTLYKSINKLGEKAIELTNKKAHIGWTSGGHTAHLVPIFAVGPNANLFTGWHDNTEIIPLLRQAITTQESSEDPTDLE